MGKYNVNINMNNRNCSHTLILEQIRPKSKVLELGCATGYMTRYMNTNLKCTVDVVDYDCESVAQASVWANDYICDDLNDGNWFVHYYQKDNEYDYILFADVLEHLTEPEDALKWAVRLLKDDGKIIVSIPNICHNDIIVQMYNNHFRYTDLGLLDSTHIHFWGHDEILDFLNSAGLKVVDERTVQMPTQGTEQRLPFRMNGELIELLKNREYGEVYQWVFTCEKR